jgi:hypothetical protein
MTENTAKSAKPKRRRGQPRAVDTAAEAAASNNGSNGANGSTALVKPIGRKPRVPYSEEVAEKLFERLRNGETLKVACRDKGMPRAALVRQWAMEDEVFGEKLQRARELGCQAMADEIIDFSDNKSTEPGKVARDRLRVDSRKWLLARILPAIYGDRVEVAAKAGIVVVQLDKEDLAL